MYTTNLETHPPSSTYSIFRCSHDRDPDIGNAGQAGFTPPDDVQPAHAVLGQETRSTQYMTPGKPDGPPCAHERSSRRARTPQNYKKRHARTAAAAKQDQTRA